MLDPFHSIKYISSYLYSYSPRAVSCCCCCCCSVGGSGGVSLAICPMLVSRMHAKYLCSQVFFPFFRWINFSRIWVVKSKRERETERACIQRFEFLICFRIVTLALLNAIWMAKITKAHARSNAGRPCVLQFSCWLLRSFAPSLCIYCPSRSAEPSCSKFWLLPYCRLPCPSSFCLLIFILTDLISHK